MLLHQIPRNESSSRSSSQVLVVVDHLEEAQDEGVNNRRNFILKNLFKKNEKYFIFLVVGFTFSAAQQEIDALRYSQDNLMEQLV
jgi:hypothetical protein